jgi:hypothetical protein
MLKMIGNDNYIGVDHKSSLLVSNSIGRSSVRIESKQSYTQGLFVVDLKHMPAGACGTWPAFWSLGSGAWPTNGEIDIIEGVNQNSVNKMVLHTDTDCKVCHTILPMSWPLNTSGRRQAPNRRSSTIRLRP